MLFDREGVISLRLKTLLTRAVLARLCKQSSRARCPSRNPAVCVAIIVVHSRPNRSRSRLITGANQAKGRPYQAPRSNSSTTVSLFVLWPFDESLSYHFMDFILFHSTGYSGIWPTCGEVASLVHEFGHALLPLQPAFATGSRSG